jgi:CheY-like chemotaxis protein
MVWRLQHFCAVNRPLFMKHKNILLVANDNIEILNVQRELTQNKVSHSLHVARNGLEALALLMGCSSPMLENYSKTGKVQPDVLLMDVDSAHLHMVELLSIMQKYYSLQKIKVFLLTHDPERVFSSNIDKRAITGIVTKPFCFESNMFDSDKLRRELCAGRQKAWLPMLTITPGSAFIKSLFCRFAEVRDFFPVMWTSMGIKVAAVSAVVAVGTMLSLTHSKPKEKITAKILHVKLPEHPFTVPAKVENPPDPEPKGATNTKTEAKTCKTTIAVTTPAPMEQHVSRAFKIQVLEDEDNFSEN